MSEVYYREHYIDPKICPVHYHKDSFLKNILYISTLTQADSEIIYPENNIPNWHKNLEILYCTEGKGNVMCAGKIYEFQEGDIFIVNSENTHMITSDFTLQYHCIIIDHSFLENACLDISKTEFCALIDDSKLTEIYMEIVDLLKNSDHSDTDFKIDIRIKVLALILYLSRNYVYAYGKEAASRATSDYCKKAIEYIRKNFAKVLTVDEIAEECMINKAYLSRIFKKETNKTLVEFINIIRCNEAKRLINQGISIKESAFSCGFDNLSYFSKTYKRHIGYMPSEERKSLPQL